MYVSRLTALTIAARDDIECAAGLDPLTGKYVGWVTLGPDDRCRPLLNTAPAYDTAEEAKADMERFVRRIREAESTAGG